MQDNPQTKSTPSHNISSSKQEIISWNASEYSLQKKGSDWFWAVGIIALSFTVVAILYDNILFAIFIILGSGTLALHAIKEPRMITFQINGRGVAIDKALYPYSTLESFWIINENRGSKILIKSRKMLMPYLIIPTGDANPDEIKAYLREYLPETTHTEPLSHKIMEYLGF